MLQYTAIGTIKPIQWQSMINQTISLIDFFLLEME